MSQPVINHLDGQLVDEQFHFTLVELCQSCQVSQETISTWVLEGVLEPIGHAPEDWRFAGTSLRRARLATQLASDLEVNAPGIALALDLIEQIAALNAQMQRISHY